MAQPNTNSPYSRYGLGDLQNRTYNFLDQMGGIGAAYNSPYFVNNVNPASYSYLKTAAFDIGLDAKYSTLDDGETKQSLWSGNLSYLSLAFPLGNFINDALERIERDFKIAMGVSLMPYSTVGYNISSTDTLTNIGEVINNFQGNGGAYQVLYGASVKYKDFSFGIQPGYLFGNIEFQRNVLFQDLDGAFNNLFKNSYGLSGFLLNTGFMYSTVLNKSLMEKDRSVAARRISVGIHSKLKTNFNTKEDILEETVQNVLGTAGPRDTLLVTNDLEGSGTLPTKVGIGFFYEHGDKYGIGVDYSFTKWSQYSNSAQEESLNDTYKVSLGGYFRPNAKSYNNFLARVIYRYGVFYQTDPISINSESLNNRGVSFGMGMPFVRQRKISHANLGVTIGQRGKGTVISENYVKLNFSFTFNDDEWFIKRKYN